jgi:toxin ParE1/3/4
MTLPLRLLPEARAEFDDATDWYETHQSGLGVDFVAKVGTVFKRIAANPKIHAIVYKDVRKAVVDRFPYVVRYQEEPHEVIVISVFHTSRNPDVWKSRA